MIKSETKKGFDSPKFKKEDDLLNRWRFAQEIYTIAINTSDDWSVRIGIYARWGEGKSTVLGFVENMANRDNHLCLFFNPWEYSSADELWENFILQLIDKIEEANIEVNNVEGIKNRIKYNRLLKKGEELADGVLKEIPYIGKIGIPLLKIFISDNRGQLKKLGESIKGKKFLIIFDDLDRANPKVVPQILYALREILDLPGFSFLLAFDPHIVSKALKNYHIGFDDTLDFLDKIIDFPKWLPPATDKDLIKLAKLDILNYCSFIPNDAFIQVFKYLPKNPRALRRFIRQFIGVNKEIDRYEKGEIDWLSFLLMQILKNYFPSATYDLFNNTELWNEIVTDRFFGNERRGGESNDKYEVMINDICQKNNITIKSDILKLTEIIKFIVSKDQRLSNINISRYLTLTENPEILTWKEFNELIIGFEKNKSVEYIGHFLTVHCSKNDFLKDDLIKTLYTMTLDYRNWCLREAADTSFHQNIKNHLNDSLLALDILEIISYNFDGFVNDVILDISDYRKLYDSVAQWILLKNTKEYQNLRSKEKNFIVGLSNKMEGDLLAIFSSLTPWMSARLGVYNSKEEGMLSKQITNILEKRIADGLIDNFLKDNWVTSIYNLGDNFALHYVLFRKNSPLWKGKLRKKFIELLKDNPNNEVIKKNLAEYLYIINDFVFDSYDPSKMQNDESILSDKILIIKIWKFVLKNKLNPKMFKSFEALKIKIENRFEYKLPLPRWWEVMKRNYDSSKQNGTS